jgi:hypothetical protein
MRTPLRLTCAESSGTSTNSVRNLDKQTKPEIKGVGELSQVLRKKLEKQGTMLKKTKKST